jgi:hypothetical protein
MCEYWIYMNTANHVHGTCKMLKINALKKFFNYCIPSTICHSLVNPYKILLVLQQNKDYFSWRAFSVLGVFAQIASVLLSQGSELRPAATATAAAVGSGRLVGRSSGLPACFLRHGICESAQRMRTQIRL